MHATRAVRRLPLLLAAVVAAPLLLGACGSGSNVAQTGDLPSATSPPRGSSDVATTTTTDPEETTTTRKRSTTTTDPDDTTSTTKRSTTTTGPVAPGYEAFCGVYAKYDEQFDDIDDDDPTYLAQFKAAMADLLSVSPDEIKPDVAILNDFIQSLTSMDEFLTAPQAVQDASDRLDGVTDTKCGRES